VFFAVEIIVREFSVDALFTVMLSAMIADITAEPFLGSRPFLSGFPPGITLPQPRDYLLIAVLAVVAALMGLGFTTVLYWTEDLCDRIWGKRPEWARPAAGGIVLGLLLLAVPQLYGVGYPVMYQTTAGDYAIWFMLLLAFGKIAATSLSLGIGGSGGVFAPALFIGVTSGMAFGDIAARLFGPAAGQPVLYAVVAMGAVFTAAARAPLTSLASVVELTGDFSLTLPVMLAVAVASAVSRALSYGTIYTTKLLRRGTDIDQATPWRALADLQVTDAMHPLRVPLPVRGAASGAADGEGGAADGEGGAADGEGGAADGVRPGQPPDLAAIAGPVTRRIDPQAVFGGETLGQALRQLEVYGRDGLPVLSGDGRLIEGWLTNASVLQALAAKLSAAQADAARAQLAADWGHDDLESAVREPPDPLPGYQVAEISIAAGSAAAGKRLGDVAWPAGYTPVSVLRGGQLRPASPALVLRSGDRLSLLFPAPPAPTAQ
jgi:chloride channel protein, CIC family